jgi:hypothetical protein
MVGVTRIRPDTTHHTHARTTYMKYQIHNTYRSHAIGHKLQNHSTLPGVLEWCDVQEILVLMMLLWEIVERVVVDDDATKLVTSCTWRPRPREDGK